MSGRFRRLAFKAAAGIAIANAAPAHAEYLPLPETLATPGEAPLLASLLEQIATLGEEDQPALLKMLDDTLAKLPRPTKFRGFVQMSRVDPLLAAGRKPEAIAAIEESIRLLPDSTGPLLVASSAYSFTEEPERAADYLIRASRVGPEDLRRVKDYEVMALFRRLWIKGDNRRAAVLGARLLEIGWTGTSVSSRSAIAARVIKEKLATGDGQGARGFVRDIVVPAHAHGLLISNQYKDIWNALEEWSGEKMRLLWTVYLNESRARWSVSQAPEVLGDYVNALLSAGHDEAVIREVLPVFERKLDKRRDYDLLFLAASVAKPLMRQGRWDDLHKLYARLEQVWPIGSDANALNVAGNHALWLLYQGRPAEALAKLDRVIADANKRRPEVDSFSLAGMHSQRACMLTELGRRDEALAIAPVLIATKRPTTIAGYYLCAGDHDRARAALIEGLADPSTRDEVIAYVQPSDDKGIPTTYGRKRMEMFERLRSDPALVKEVVKHGRILPWALSDAAPPEGV